MKLDIFEKAKKHFENGLKFFQEQLFDLSEKEFLLSLKLIPNRLSTIDNLIKIYIKTENKKKLDEILNKSVQYKDENIILAGQAYKNFLYEDYEISLNYCNRLLENRYLEYDFSDLKASNLKQQKKFLEAVKIYKKLLFFKDKKFFTFCQIGRLFYELGKIRQAKYYFEKSNKLQANNNTNLWYLSLCNLTLKNFKDGFSLYENRWKNGDGAIKKFQKIPELKSLNDLKNKKILIWGEQGLGDTIQFSRFVIDLLKYTKTLTLAVNKKLVKILSNLDVNIILVDELDVIESEYDFQLALCSLPKLLKTKSTKDINFYKLVLKNKIEILKNINNKKLNIGIACSGNKNYLKDKYRSVSFKYFEPIIKNQNINFYKLSQGFNKNELDIIQNYNNVFDCSDTSFFELSHLIKNLDLIISIDTSIIHLSGTLGINSILLLNYNSDWRWFDDNETTIWYPSVKIIKQKEFDEWNAVFKILSDNIDLLAKKKASKNSPF